MLYILMELIGYCIYMMVKIGLNVMKKQVVQQVNILHS